MSRIGVLTIHHIKKVGFELFPRDFLIGMGVDEPNIFQVGMFVKAAGMLQTDFLKRYITRLTDGRIAVLNDGYSIAVFPGDNWQVIIQYLLGVEQTFDVIFQVLFDELKQFLVIPNQKIVRYYAIKIERKDENVIEEFALESNHLEKLTVIHSNGAIKLRFFR
jgi:hypothetical protein